MTDTSDDENKKNRKAGGPGVLKVMQSILAGALGVQSDKRLEEDFSSHSPWPYIIAGVLFTAGFVVGLIFIVQMVLSNQ